MLLNELISVKKYKHRSFYAVLQDFEKAGGDVFSGKYGYVLTHPRWNYVMKAFPSDPEYLRFIRWAKRRQDLIAVPRVFGGPWKIIPFYARSIKEPRYLYVVKIEKLHPITDQELRKHIGRWVEHGLSMLEEDKLPDADEGVREFLALDSQYGTMSWHDRMAARDPGWKNSASRYEDLRRKWKWLAQARQQWATYPGLKAACEAYAELDADNVQGSPDLHGDNFMQRANGELVMTDPLWAGETPYQAYDAAMRAEMMIDDEPEEPDEYNTIPGGKLRAKRRPAPKPYPPMNLDDFPF